MRCLVTGGAGFIGSHVVDHLISSGHEVTVLDDLSGGFSENVSIKARLIHGSIISSTLIDHIFKEYGFDYVYHCAAYAAEGLSHFIRRYNYENNLIGSVNLINASVREKVRCFVFLSSIAVYGSQKPPMREDMVPTPEDPYGISKYAVELDLKAAHEMFGLNYVIFRLHNVYGERQNVGDPYRNVVGIFMNQLLKGEQLTIFGDGEQTRAFTYIRDIVPAISRCVALPGIYNQVFNIGNSTPYSVNNLVYHVQNAMEIHTKVKHLGYRKEVAHAFSDHAKFLRYFPETKETSILEGLRLMSVWVKKNGSKQRKQFENIEIERNLPESWRQHVNTTHSL